MTRPSSAPECAPRFYTPRDPTRKTLGGRWAKISQAIGQPYMPWQRMVADVAGEIDPDTGQLYYSEVDVTVPRQCGKTTLVLSVATDRGILPWGSGRQSTIYAAQTRNDARKKLLDEQKPLLEGSGVGRFMLKPRLTNGGEQLRWRNGSTHGLMAVTKKSGHGPTIDVGFLDEFFAQVDNRLEQAVRPSMITRPSRQLWVVSTAGDATSFPLRAKVDRGRARSQSGRHGRIASFEWSAPDDADPNDPATWWATIPALGYTQTLAAIEGERDGLDGGMDEFMRAYLNMWRDGMNAAQVIPDPEWQACEDPYAAPHGRVAFAIDVAPDSSWSSIAVGGRTEQGNPHGQLIEHRPGTGWVVDRVVELARKWQPLAIALDPRSAAAALLNDLVTARVEPLVLPQMAEMAQACGALYNSATSQPTEGGLLLPPTFRHRGQQQLNSALAGAAKRTVGTGGAWLWDRRDSSVDISPLVAVTLASWVHDREALKAVDVLSSIW